MKPYTIRKLKHRPGSLYVDFRIGGYKGKRHVLALHTLDKQVARLKAAELFTQHAGTESLFTSRTTVDEFLTQYRNWANTQKPARTRETEEAALRRFCEFNQRKHIADITHRDVDLFIQHLASSFVVHRFRNGKHKPSTRKVSAPTIHSYIRTLRAIFQMAVRWKLISLNPFAEAPLPKYEKPLPVTFTMQEVRAVLDATAQHAPECLDLFIVYFLTGMRVSEALRLTWDDVDFERDVIVLRKTKGRKVRHVPMTAIVRNIFLRRRQFDTPWPPVLISTKRNRKRQFKRDYVGRQFARMVKLAGIDHKPLKRSRGTFATALLEVAGLSVVSTTAIVGHADIRTTQDYYFNPIGAETFAKLSAIDAQFAEILPKSG